VRDAAHSRRARGALRSICGRVRRRRKSRKPPGDLREETMQVEHHELHNDFPNLVDEIQALKTGNSHFAHLMDEYNTLTREVERLEEEDIPVDDFTIEDLKKKRIKLKDELYQMIVARQNGRKPA
jgi:uncharacterized protein